MISLHVVEEPEATMMARRDFAKVRKEKHVEPPFWFEDDKTGRLYRNLYICIGWPQRVTERGDSLPGYSAVVGVLKEEDVPAIDSRFMLLAEVEEHSVEQLLTKAVVMRREWGFGVKKDLLSVFYGDFRPFELTVANYNGVVIEMEGNDRNAVVVIPNDDYDTPQAFDVYLRRLESVLSEDGKRLFLGDSEIVRNRLLSFVRDDPAITGLGGMVHSLLMRTPWMEDRSPTVFSVNF